MASDEELDPYLLAVLLLQEGEDRMAFADNPLTGILFRTLEVGAGTIKNDSIGIAQMQPDTARRRMGATSTSRWDAAVLLAYNDEAAIRLAASHLKYLQTKFQLTNMQTYVAYAGSEGDAIPAYLSGGPADRALYPRMFAREAGYNVQFERVSGMFLGFGVVE